MEIHLRLGEKFASSRTCEAQNSGAQKDEGRRFRYRRRREAKVDGNGLGEMIFIFEVSEVRGAIVEDVYVVVIGSIDIGEAESM